MSVTHQSGGVRSGRWGAISAALASLSAVLSSACCWIPLLMIGAGASVTGAAALFEAYRVPFLLGATLFLGIGYYFSYRREPSCGADGACDPSNSKSPRLTRWTLWMATVIVIVFATFPNLVGRLFPDARIAAVEFPVDGQVSHTYFVEGMTCEGCAQGLKTALLNVKGVTSADVVYAKQEASVRFRDAEVVNDEAILRTVAKQGYVAKRIEVERGKQ